MGVSSPKEPTASQNVFGSTKNAVNSSTRRKVIATPNRNPLITTLYTRSPTRGTPPISRAPPPPRCTHECIYTKIPTNQGHLAQSLFSAAAVAAAAAAEKIGTYIPRHLSMFVVNMRRSYVLAVVLHPESFPPLTPYAASLYLTLRSGLAPYT